MELFSLSSFAWFCLPAILCCFLLKQELDGRIIGVNPADSGGGLARRGGRGGGRGGFGRGGFGRGGYNFVR